MNSNETNLLRVSRNLLGLAQDFIAAMERQNIGVRVLPPAEKFTVKDRASEVSFAVWQQPAKMEDAETRAASVLADIAKHATSGANGLITYTASGLKLTEARKGQKAASSAPENAEGTGEEAKPRQRPLRP